MYLLMMKRQERLTVLAPVVLVDPLDLLWSSDSGTHCQDSLVLLQPEQCGLGWCSYWYYLSLITRWNSLPITIVYAVKLLVFFVKINSVKYMKPNILGIWASVWLQRMRWNIFPISQMEFSSLREIMDTSIKYEYSRLCYRMIIIPWWFVSLVFSVFLSSVIFPEVDMINNKHGTNRWDNVIFPYICMYTKTNTKKVLWNLRFLLEINC